MKHIVDGAWVIYLVFPPFSFHFIDSISVLQVLATSSYIHCFPLAPLTSCRFSSTQLIISYGNSSSDSGRMVHFIPSVLGLSGLSRFCVLCHNHPKFICVPALLCLEKKNSNTLSLKLPTTSYNFFTPSSGMTPETYGQGCDMYVLLWMTFTPGC